MLLQDYYVAGVYCTKLDSYTGCCSNILCSIHTYAQLGACRYLPPHQVWSISFFLVPQTLSKLSSYSTGDPSHSETIRGSASLSENCTKCATEVAGCTILEMTGWPGDWQGDGVVALTDLLELMAVI